MTDVPTVSGKKAVGIVGVQSRWVDNANVSADSSYLGDNGKAIVSYVNRGSSAFTEMAFIRVLYVPSL